ncbi:DUF1311 domain-containing protein [Sinirhodobacter sp. HNIBRBA609]|nr:DUF1311 domain-containing protein [Sinirhodobacter sp. HNIBRBA609]
MRALALALLRPAPVLAQGALPVDYDASVVEACLGAKSTEACNECIGVGAAHCMLTSDGGSTNAGMGFCFGAERADWDARLNAAYQELMAAETATDAEMAEIGSAAAPMAPALQQMQRAWIAFRDAACEYEMTQWGGGSGAGPAGSACTMRMTALQALELMARLEDKAR